MRYKVTSARTFSKTIKEAYSQKGGGGLIYVIVTCGCIKVPHTSFDSTLLGNFVVFKNSFRRL